MRKVFLSSTARDLQAYRDAVFRAIQACDDLRVVRMEDFGARAAMTDAFCREKVAECDLFIGIVGHYFGSSPANSTKSYTQQEYDAAVETNKPRLMFLAPDDFPLPAHLIEEEDKRKRQREFRARVRAEHLLAEFSDPQDLATKVMAAIHNYERAPDFSAAEKRYLEQIVARTELLEFVGIPDPRQNAAVKLADIFIPLGVEEEIETSDFREPDTPTGKDVLERRARERIVRKTTRRVALEDALRAHTRLMVLGDPGAGKSTLLRYLALVAVQSATEDGGRKTKDGGRMTEDEGLSIFDRRLPIENNRKSKIGNLHSSFVIRLEQRLPILLPLRRFAASGQALVDFLYTYAKQTYQLELPRGFFERALEAGRCLVLFDGLDEVTASNQRVEVRDAVAALATRYPKNRFVVTSRIIGYESAPLDRRAFAHHIIMPFTESEIETFIEKWYTARERDANQAQAQADHLIRTIKQNDRLKKLAENPLMLTIIALVHRIEAELPNERVKLYDKCTEALLSMWEGVQGVPYDRERPHYKYRRRLLERLAFWMHTLGQAEGRQAEVKRGDLELKLTDLLCEDEKLGLGRDAARAEAQVFIELAKSRTGILVERGDGIFSFVHLTFQEYFAACDLEARYVHNLDALWKQIQPHLYDARWREVILLLLGRLNRYDEPPNAIFEKILRERDKFDDVIHRNLFLAAQCLAHGISIRERLRNYVVDTLLEFARAASPKYDSLPYDAIAALGTLRGNARAGEGLLALAQDEKVNWWVPRNAAEALKKLGRADDAVIHGLMALAQDEKMGADVRRDAAEALGRLGRTDDAVRILLTLLQDEKVDERVRRTAAEALGKLGKKSPRVAVALLKLASDKDDDVRNTAYRALKEVVGNLRWKEVGRR